MTKARLSTANISANAVCTARQRSICLKGKNPNAKAAEKANKNRAAQARREQAGFQKLSEADESVARRIRLLQVFAEKDRRLRVPGLGCSKPD